MSDETEIDHAEQYDRLKERYAFYVMNPRHTKGVEYSLWVRTDGGDEYPILSSNTGGFATFNSRHDEVGDALEPTEQFLDLVGMAFHEAMVYGPAPFFRQMRFRDTANRIYNDAPREYEVWVGNVLVDWMCSEGEMIEELRPLCEWAASFSEFGMPRLEGGGDD